MVVKIFGPDNVSFTDIENIKKGQVWREHKKIQCGYVGGGTAQTGGNV